MQPFVQVIYLTMTWQIDFRMKTDASRQMQIETHLLVMAHPWMTPLWWELMSNLPLRMKFMSLYWSLLHCLVSLTTSKKAAEEFARMASRFDRHSHKQITGWVWCSSLSKKAHKEVLENYWPVSNLEKILGKVVATRLGGLWVLTSHTPIFN